MKTQPKLVRIVTPPPTGPSNLMFGQNLNRTTSTALSVHISKTIPTATSTSSTSTSTRIQNVTMHPSERLVAYFMIPETADSKKSTTIHPLSSVVVQDLKTRQTIWNMSLGDIARTLFDYDIFSKTAAQRQAKILKDLGQVQRLEFFDSATLYWTGYGIHGNGDGGGNDPFSSSSRSLLSTATTSSSSSRFQQQQLQQTQTQRWSHLFVQFTNRILLINLRRHAITIFATTVGIGTSGGVAAATTKTAGGSTAGVVETAYKPLLAHVTQEALGSQISSNALPISRHVLLVGTTDGMLKVFDWSKNLVTKSVKLLPSKSDCIVHICAANRYSSRQHEQQQQQQQQPSSDVASTPLSLSSSIGSQPSPSSSSVTTRFAVLTKKGLAYIVEMTIDYAKSTDGTPTVVEIGAPIARLDGGSVPTSMTKTDDDTSQMEHVYITYDGFRDLLLWSNPSKSKAKLFVWDLAQMTTGQQDKDNSTATPKQSRKKGTDLMKPDPLLVLQFPYETTHTFFPGWMHESVPMDSMTCVAVTREGSLQILVAPLYNSGSSAKNPFAAVRIMSVDLGQVVYRKYLEVAGVNPGAASAIQPPVLRVQSVDSAPLRDASIFYIGTNMGILLVRMVDWNLVPVPGSCFAHLSANMGSLGKSVLMVKHSEVIYGALESSVSTSRGTPSTTTAAAAINNPIGTMELSKSSGNKMVVYESPPPLHLPAEIHKRPVRLPPCLIPSPSRNFLCCFWREEMRYEVLHIPTMLQRVTSRSESGNSPVSASGNGVASFAWIGDDDAFALLYNPEQDTALKVGIDAPSATLGRGFTNAASKVADLSKLRELGRLKDFAGSAQAAIGVGKVKASNAATSKVRMNTVKASKAGTTRLVVGLLGKRRQGQGSISVGLAQAEADDEEEAVPTTPSVVAALADSATTEPDEDTAEPLVRKHPWVEIRALVGAKSNAADMAGSASSIAASNLGQLTLRSGNRNPPTVLFGGPVLCVASKLDEDDEGLAYFYTRKKGEDDTRAAIYVSSGPAFPCPDIVSWDDDGRLCAVVIQARVAIYLSDEPDFVLLGTVRVGSSADADVKVVSVRFIHGVLYCTTRSSVHCVFLGDLEKGGICHLDLFTLASTEVPTLPSKSILTDQTSLTPPTIPMPLNNPMVMGYQNGSLMLSTVSGIQAIPLNHPLLRIGALIAAGHHARAERWFEAVDESDHEALAFFLDRRGVPEMALQLSGLSLETTVDLCMRYGFTERLEEVVDQYGVKGLRSIDMGRGLSSNIFGLEENGASVVVCVGAYLLSQGKIEFIRRLATECLSSGEDGKREAFFLASLLLSVDGNDSKRVLQRAVEDVEDDNSWVVGNYVRDHILMN